MAIARSLINDPYIILADEATGNLDSKTSEEIMAMLEKLNDAGKTIIMVTHEQDIAEHAKRIIWMKDGHIIQDGPSPRMLREQAAAEGRELAPGGRIEVPHALEARPLTPLKGDGTDCRMADCRKEDHRRSAI